MTMNTVKKDWKERRLVEQLRALRSLPPATHLETLPPPGQELLTELLLLGDEIDPLQWLIESHGELCARILLGKAVDVLRLTVAGIQRAERLKQAILTGDYQQLPEDWRRLPMEVLLRLTDVSDSQQWLGNLCDLSMEVFQPFIDRELISISPELLTSMFQMMTTARGNSGKLSDKVIRDEFLMILNDLFQLSQEIDLLLWIHDKYGHIAARETLNYLLTRILPNFSLLTSEQSIQIIRPNIHLYSTGLTIVLQEINIKKRSFILTLQTYFSKELLQILFHYPGYYIKWEGIEQIVDDLNYQYLVCYRLEEGETRTRSLQLLCYPAILPTATRITLRSEMTLFVKIIPEHKIIHSIDLGVLVWHIPVHFPK